MSSGTAPTKPKKAKAPTSLQKSAERALEAILLRVEKAETFAIAQAPEICKELVREAWISEGLEFVGALVAALVGVTLCYFLSMKGFSSPSDSGAQVGCVVAASFIGLGAIMGIWICCVQAKILLTLKFCPKIVLIRKLKRLIGK